MLGAGPGGAPCPGPAPHSQIPQRFYPGVIGPLWATVVFYCLGFLVLSGGRGGMCNMTQSGLVCFNLLV